MGGKFSGYTYENNAATITLATAMPNTNYIIIFGNVEPSGLWGVARSTTTINIKTSYSAAEISCGYLVIGK